MSNSKRSIDGIPLGMWVRNQFGKAIIFRVRKGNGFFGAIDGHKYQDKYTYVVPGSINNAAGEPARANLRAAVDYWKNILTTDEKEVYNKRAEQYKGLIGYNLFLREALNGDFSMYVDRGDPSVKDFNIGDFTIDGAWHTLDLSPYIPTTARLILLDLDFDNNAANKHITFRKNGNSNNINHYDISTKVAGQDEHAQPTVTPDSGRLIEYKIDSAGWILLSLSVRGWWT